VEAVLQAAFRELCLAPTFAQLRPAQSATPGYTLLIAASTLGHDLALQQQLCEIVESGLAANPGYRYARDIGQLGPLEIKILSEQEAGSLVSKQIAERAAAGQRLGDIKPASLHHAR
jgi:hypothetical protein